MRNVCYLVGLLLVAAPATSQDSLKFGPPISIGYGRLPRWSPDGTQLAYLRGDSLYIAHPPEFKDAKFVVQGVADTYQWVDNSRFDWLSRFPRRDSARTWYVDILCYSDLNGIVGQLDTDSTFFGERRVSRIRQLLPSSDGVVRYLEAQGGDRQNVKPRQLTAPGVVKDSSATSRSLNYAFVREGSRRWPSSGDIWILDLNSLEEKQITFGPQKWLFIVKLSPSSEFVATNNARGEIVVLDTTGAIRANAGFGETGDWAPNSRLLVFRIPEETERNIIGSELFVYDITTDSKSQLTDTPDLIEEDPVWSPDGGFIAYGTMNAEKLYVIGVGGVR